MGEQHQRRCRDLRNRREISGHVKGHSPVEPFRHDGARLHEQQGVPIGSRLRDITRPDHRAGTRPIFHNNGLPQLSLQLVCDDAGRGINCTAGGNGHHDGDRTLTREVVKRRPESKILLTSGFPGGRLADAEGLGSAVRLLSKPYRKDDLARAVREALDERS
jgi:hypothetical protein